MMIPKKTYLLMIALPLLIAIPLYVVAAKDVDLSQKGINAIFGRIADILWVVAVGIIIIVFVWAGIQFLMTKGDPGKIGEARSTLIWGLIGTAVIMLAWSIGNFVKFILGV